MKRTEMRKKLSVLALAISMSCTALGSAAMLPVLAADDPVSKTQNQNQGTKPAAADSLPGLRAAGGYGQIVLTIDRQEGDSNTYSILRSASADGTFEKVGETAGSSWTDTTVTAEETYYYKLQNGTETSANATEVSTGKDAYLAGSALNKTLSESEAVFDGNKVVDLSSGIDRIKELSEGSVYIRFKAEDAVDTTLHHLLTYFNSADPVDMNGQDPTYSTDKIIYLALDHRSNTQKVRADLTGGAKATNGSGYGDGNWHTLVLTCRSDAPTFAVSVDGSGVMNYSQAAFKGLFTRLASANTLQIGGYKPADTVYEGFHGEISQVAISSEALTLAQANSLTSAEQSQFKKDMFSLDEIGQTWMFVGGQEVAADYEHVGGLRSFVYHFEEYARWEKPRQISTAVEPLKIGHSHFVTNGAKKGNKLSDVLQSLAAKQNVFHARTVVYTPGIEDITDYIQAENKETWKTAYQASLNQLKGAVTSGYLIVQTPHAYKDASQNEAASQIAALIKSTFASDTSADPKVQKVFIVDQFTSTNTETFKSTCLNEDGQLDGNGHYEMALTLERATGGSTTGDYNAGNLDDCVPVSKPEYRTLPAEQEALSASFTGESLDLTLAAQSVLGTANWIVTAEDSGLTLSTPLSAGQSVSLPVNDGSWTLRIVSADGKAELPSYTISKGDARASRKSLMQDENSLNDSQKKIRELLASDEKLTWVFYGDSITHGCRHTRGYDTIVQLFDKYMHDPNGLNRPDDLIINTAVSGAIARDTLSDPHKTARMQTYVPDVAMIMLAMNDCAASGVTPDLFKSQLKENIELIKAQNPNVLIVLRACNVTTASGRGNLKQYIAKVREVAEEDGYILADHAATWDAAIARQSNANQGGTGNLNSDGLHPNGTGHKVMFNDLTKAMGIFDESNTICRLDYRMNQTARTSTVQPEPQTGPGELSVDLTSMLENGKTAGTAEVSVTIDGITWTKNYDRADSTSPTTIRFTGLPGGKQAAVNVKIATTDSVVTTYAPAQVTIPSSGLPADIVFNKASAGYANVNLSFENSTGATVTILRAESQDGPFTQAGTSNATSFVDSVEPEKTYFYRLSWNDGTAHTSETKEVKTGMDAYKANAEVYKPLARQTFDGSQLVDISDQAETVSKMSSGSLFFRFRTEASTDSMALVYGKVAGTTTTLIKSGGGTVNRHSIILHPLGENLSLRPDLAHTRADANTDDLGDGEWHNVVLVCNPGSAHTFCWYIDGVMAKEFDGAGNAGFFSTLAGMNQLTLGGYYNGTDTQTVIDGFKGQMRDVIFSDECLNTANAQQITAAAYSETDPEPEPELVKDVLQAAADYASSLDGAFENKDAEFDAVLKQALSVLENPESQEQIDSMALTLNNSLLALRRTPSKEALDALNLEN